MILDRRVRILNRDNKNQKENNKVLDLSPRIRSQWTKNSANN